MWSATLATSRRQHQTHPGNVMKALTRLIGSVPIHDHPIELHNLLLEVEQLRAKRARHARATSGTRSSLVASGVNSVKLKDLLDNVEPDGRDPWHLSAWIVLSGVQSVARRWISRPTCEGPRNPASYWHSNKTAKSGAYARSCSGGETKWLGVKLRLRMCFERNGQFPRCSVWIRPFSPLSSWLSPY